MRLRNLIVTTLLLSLSSPVISDDSVESYNNGLDKYNSLSKELTELSRQQLINEIKLFSTDEDGAIIRIPPNKLNCRDMEVLEKDYPEMKSNVARLKPMVQDTMMHYQRIIDNADIHSTNGNQVHKLSSEIVADIKKRYDFEEHLEGVDATIRMWGMFKIVAVCD